MALAESSSMISHRGLVAFAARDGDRTVVWLQGEHDVSTVAALSETMARAIAHDDADLVVDLSGVQFMGAATVGVILRASDFLAFRSRSLTLRSPSTCAGRILDLCGITDLLDPRPVAAPPSRGAGTALGRLVPVPAAAECVNAHPAAEGDLQQLARRGDATLLSLLRLDTRNPARPRMSRASRSTRFARPS